MRLPGRPKLNPLHIDDLKEHGEEFKRSLKKRADLVRGSVADLLPGRSVIRRQNGDDLPPRPVVNGRQTPVKSRVPALDIPDDVLNRMFIDDTRHDRRPTSKFFHKQRARAGFSSPDLPETPPKSSRSNHRPDRGVLSADDLIYMFAGAPYFDVEHVEGNAVPRVVFGWGPAMEESKHASDSKSFTHKTFELCTRDRPRRTHGLREARHVREVPSMRSAQGRDAGTIGYSNFLELHTKRPEKADYAKRRRRQQLIVAEPEKYGLCEYNLENILHRLAELSRVFEMLHQGNGDPREWSARMIEEIGEDLFSTLLSGELGTTAAGTGSVSLLTQISALQKVLTIPDLWCDFSSADERDRLPQTLWQDTQVNGEDISEREALILQVALGAELAVRLEIATRLAACEFRHPGIFAPGDLDIILREQVDKLSWDIVLFRRFIHSFEGITTSAVPSRPESKNPLHRLSWTSNVQSDAISVAPSVASGDFVFRAQNESSQIDGLRTFAESLGWTELDLFGTAALRKSDSFLSPPSADRPVSGVTEYDTPLASPSLPSWQGLQDLEYDKDSARLVTQPGDTTSQRAWLVRAWQSGFVMPGEQISEMLMTVCLEKTPSAKHISAGTRSDGFVFNNQMFWHKTGIAYRVLAAAVGAQECMGWVSLPYVPQGAQDGWLAIAAQADPASLSEPRLNDPENIATASDPLHLVDSSQLRTEDFRQPIDDLPLPGNEVLFNGVSLRPTAGNEAHTMSLAFQSAVDSSQPALHLRLVHAVHFVSSYPCFPYTKRRRPLTPAHDSLAPTDSGHSTPMSSPREKELPLPPAHPLHRAYTFVVIPAAALLSSSNKDDDSLVLVNPDDNEPTTYHIEDEDVVVLDCRGSPDLEVLARAWCSKVGENALIGKGGRTCLACCVREAMALGMGVVIRT